MSFAQSNGEMRPPKDDSVFDVLGNQRRRYVVSVLAQEDGPVDIGTLAERVAALESDRPVEEISYAQRKSVYTGLHQNHLPKMEQAGLITSGKGWTEIELNDSGDEVTQFLEWSVNEGRNVRYEQVVLTFVIGLLIGTWVPLAPVSNLMTPISVVAVLLLVAGIGVGGFLHLR